MKRLWRENQCEKCPWKKNTDPNRIPNGYSQKKHKALSRTIAEPGTLHRGNESSAMACHESVASDKEPYCIGWLMHQLGPGNNLMLRLKMRNYDLTRVSLDGEQHEEFKDTLPKENTNE